MCLKATFPLHNCKCAHTSTDIIDDYGHIFVYINFRKKFLEFYILVTYVQLSNTVQ